MNDKAGFVGLHYLPGFMWGQLWPNLWQTLQNAPTTGLFVYLSDQIQELEKHLLERKYPEGTTIVYRSTYRTYQYADTAQSWIDSENAFLRQKLGMLSSSPLEELFTIANNVGVELVWQVVNEKGFEPHQATTMGEFELDRLALIRPMGGILGAIGSSVSSFHRPGFVEALENTGLLAACRTKYAWFLHHMGAYLTNLVLIGPNQYMEEEGKTEKERIRAIFQIGYEDVTVEKISSGELVAWRFGDMWMEDLPELHDVRFLITEFSLGDVDLNPNHVKRSPGSGKIKGIKETWRYLEFHLDDIHEVYPEFPTTMGQWIIAELEFGARLASEHKADMKLAHWGAGGGASHDWIPYDIQFQEGWSPWSHHANTYQPLPPPKPPWSWKNLLFWRKWSSSFRVWWDLEHRE